MLVFHPRFKESFFLFSKNLFLYPYTVQIHIRAFINITSYVSSARAPHQWLALPSVIFKEMFAHRLKQLVFAFLLLKLCPFANRY